MTCSFATTNKVSFEASPSDLGLAYLHSGYNGAARTATQAPAARSITIDKGTCTEPYFVKSTDVVQRGGTGSDRLRRSWPG